MTPPPPAPILSVKTTPYNSNLDYYRGKTKSVYEKEPIFRDFVRNIPLSQSNVYDNSNITSLKYDFANMVSARESNNKSARPDPLKPSAGGPVLYQPRGESLAAKHKAQPRGPVILPFIYVYHR